MENDVADYGVERLGNILNSGSDDVNTEHQSCQFLNNFSSLKNSACMANSACLF